jgi:branched-chain amino acid transport system substrate-binding protein
MKGGGMIMVRHNLLSLGAILVATLCARAAGAEILIGMAAPMTGATNAWVGEQVEHGAAMAVADLNAAGGVLGQQVRLITVDDYCDPEQAIAAAKKLVSEGVIFVVGHFCSHSSIPASAIYEAAGILMMSPGSSNPTLTELSRANVFRFCIATMLSALWLPST